MEMQWIQNKKAILKKKTQISQLQNLQPKA